MPQPFEGAIMTDGGIALLTKAQAGECKITFTKMVIGNGEYSDEEKTTEALQARTALKSERNSYTVSSVAVYNATTVRVTALLSNEDPYTGEALINDGYYINEIGLYGKETDGDEGTEVLYSIAVTSGGQGDYMPAYNGSNPAQITQRYYATVANSLEVTVEVTNDEFVLKEDYDTEVAELTEKNAELEAKSAELEAKNAELEEKITELNDNLIPPMDISDNNFQMVFQQLSTTQITQTFEMPDDGYFSVQVRNTSGSAGVPFIRLYPDTIAVGNYLYEASGANDTYSYLQSPWIAVKKGDVITGLLGNGSVAMNIYAMLRPYRTE